MKVRMTVRAAGRCVAAALATLLVLALAPAAAHAGVGVAVIPTVPNVTVGQTVPGQLVLQNVSVNGPGESGYETDSVTVTAITLVPSCGSSTSAFDCPLGFKDAGVLVPAGSGAGLAGTACAGLTFNIAQVGAPVDGKYSFTAGSSSVTLGPSSGPLSARQCTIGFNLTVGRVPAIDSQVSQPGLQTTQLASSQEVDAGPAHPGVTASNAGSASTTVAPAVASMTTQVAPAAIVVGDAFQDTATLTPAAGVRAPTGTVTFDVYGPNDATCSGPVALTSTTPVGGGSAVSGVFTPAAAGTYRVVATYSGDALYVSSRTACGDPNETVVVSAPVTPPPPPPPPIPPATPVLSTVASPRVARGGQITDTATVRSGRPVAGTVQFRLYAPGDIDCTGTPVADSTAAISAAGTATSAPFRTTNAGTYRWRAFYGGDANNVAVSGACNAPNESVSVTSATDPQIISARFASAPVVGRSTNLVVRALAPTQDVSGMQVGFDGARAQSGLSACRVRGLGRSTNPARLTLAHVFREPGRHVVSIVVLAGDCTGALDRAETTIGVDVAPASPTRHAARSARRPSAPPVASAAAPATCKDRFLTPTNANKVRIAAATLCLVNAERRKFGRKKLIRSPRLALASSAHCKDMLRRRYFEHERVPGGPKLAARLRKARYRGRTYAENIGYGSTNTPTLQVKAWMNSPGHRRNILHPRLRFAGVGLVIGIPVSPKLPGALYTMDFGATLR